MSCFVFFIFFRSEYLEIQLYMATLSPKDFLDDKKYLQAVKTSYRRQSQCIRQQSVKELDQDNFEQQMDLLKQQETLRFRPILSDKKFKQAAYFIDVDESSFEQGYGESLRDLANEVQLQKLALQTASQIINYLKEENKCVNDKLQECSSLYEQSIKEKQQIHQKYKKQLQNAEEVIKDLEERSTKNQSILGGSIVGPKNGRYTPIKFYPKDDEDYLTPLSQIQKMIIGRRIEELETQLRYLQELIREESEDALAVAEQQKYMKDYFEDEFLGKQPFQYQDITKEKSDEEIIEGYKEIISEQEKCISEWQKYASSLKNSLIESLQFIEDLSYEPSSRNLNLTEYLQKPKIQNKDIIKHISRKVCKMKTANESKLAEQNRQLRSIIESLISKIRIGSNLNGDESRWTGKRCQSSKHTQNI